MPPKAKQTKGNPAKKEQIAEKVKEIQQRQRNWMRQRNEHVKTSSEPVSTLMANGEHGSSPEAESAARRDSVEHTAEGADILRVHRHPSPPPHHRHLASQVAEKLNVQVKHGFGAWLQSRKHADETETETHTQTPPCARDNGEQHSSGVRTGTATFLEENSNPVPSNSVSSMQNSRSYPLSPAEFDSLADSIAARVKKDLGIHRNGDARRHQRAATRDESFKRGSTFVQGSGAEQSTHKTGGGGGGDGDGDAAVDISSHRCPFCSSLMATPAHAPMLLVPCGHTVCRRCSSSQASCCLCGTRAASLTTNIMLHQIIQEFHGKGHQRAAQVSSLPASAAVTWERETALPHAPPRTTAKYSGVNYSSQLRSLQERQATLQEEASSCRRERDRVNSKVRRAEKQVQAIEREEESLAQQIQQLQEQLQGLRQHREEYSGEYRHLQEELAAASDQVTLVEQTLKSLGEEIDKVQFLAEGQKEAYLHQQANDR